MNAFYNKLQMHSGTIALSALGLYIGDKVQRFHVCDTCIDFVIRLFQ